MYIFARQVAGIAVGTMAALISWMQRRFGPVYRMSALLFSVIVVANLHATLDSVDYQMAPNLNHALNMIAYAVTFFVAPLLLFQVRLWTGQTCISSRRSLCAHLALPVLAVLATSAFMVAPLALRLVVYSGTGLEGLPVALRVVASMLLLLVPAIYTQWIVYAAIIFREQRDRRAELKTVFASTEAREMLWILGLAGVMGLHALQSAVGFVSHIINGSSPIPPALDRAVVLVVILILAIRGLRQAPGLCADAGDELQHLAEATEKYAKSALAVDHAERIARKLRTSMEHERLYRDPNLSLSKLSQHIGASPNYVSQTLNEHIEQSFFDFVNMWRIMEAKTLMVEQDCTILEIAYEVGFNSRSAFYAAFKKQVGLTPSQFKSSHAPAPLQVVEA